MERRSFNWWLPRFMIATGGAAIAIGTALVAYSYYDDYLSRTWVPVAALVTDVDMDPIQWVTKTRDGVSWIPNVHYSYAVDGHFHHARRVFAGDSERWSTRAELAQYMRGANYVRGRMVTAYYDAGEPDHAALILDLTFCNWGEIVLIGLVPFGFGFLMKKEDAGWRKRRAQGDGAPPFR